MKTKLFICFLMVGFTALSQYDTEELSDDEKKEEKKKDFYEIKKKTYVGGDFSLRFGNTTYIYASPFVGYEFYKNLSGGVIGIAQYIRVNMGTSILTEGTFGGGVFLRYTPLDFLIFQTEFDVLNSVNYTSAPGNRINFPAFMGGLGYKGNMGNKSYYYLMLMFDFIDNPNMTLAPLIPPFPIYLRYGFTFYLAQ